MTRACGVRRAWCGASGRLQAFCWRLAARLLNRPVLLAAWGAPVYDISSFKSSLCLPPCYHTLACPGAFPMPLTAYHCYLPLTLYGGRPTFLYCDILPCATNILASSTETLLLEVPLPHHEGFPGKLADSSSAVTIWLYCVQLCRVWRGLLCPYWLQ